MKAVTKRYLRSNWGFPFIVSFLLLLLSAAVFFAAGLISLAEVLAYVAYFTLAIGAILQVVTIRKQGDKGEPSSDGSS